MQLILIEAALAATTRLLQRANQIKNGGVHFHGSRHLRFGFFAVFFLRYCSALKEMNDDRDHRK